MLLMCCRRATAFGRLQISNGMAQHCCRRPRAGMQARLACRRSDGMTHPGILSPSLVSGFCTTSIGCPFFHSPFFRCPFYRESTVPRARYRVLLLQSWVHRPSWGLLSVIPLLTVRMGYAALQCTAVEWLDSAAAAGSTSEQWVTGQDWDVDTTLITPDMCNCKSHRSSWWMLGVPDPRTPVGTTAPDCWEWGNRQAVKFLGCIVLTLYNYNNVWNKNILCHIYKEYDKTGKYVLLTYSTLIISIMLQNAVMVNDVESCGEIEKTQTRNFLRANSINQMIMYI